MFPKTLLFFFFVLYSFSNIILGQGNGSIENQTEVSSSSSEKIVNDILAKSLSFYQEGKYHKAYSYCQLVFQYLEDDLPKSLKGRCYLYIGNFAVEAEHYEKAIQHFEEGLSIFKADEDKRNTAIIHNSLAVVFEKMGKYDLSLKYNFRYLDYLIAQNDSAGLTSAYNNLGNSYMGLEDYNVARTYYLKAFQIDSIKNDSLSLSADYNNLGIVFSKLQDYKTEFQIKKLQK